MCGISGIIKSSGKVALSDLKQASQVMSHRGPDAKSYWISENERVGFGHLRLSIVDPDPRSNQPFSIDNDEYVIVFNGEIYNYRSLREKIKNEHNIQFSTTSDTEVLIYMYKFFGKSFLEQIEGMFALAIYDKKMNQIFIARDFAGQKPIVYREDDEGIYFASEIPGLFALLPTSFEKRVNREALSMYLIENFFHLPHHISFFEGIKKLENAGYLLIEDGKIIDKGRYTRLQKTTVGKVENEISFLDSILDEMRPSDVGYASFLSGGIDSSYICNSLKAHEMKQTEAYTIKIAEDDSDYNRSQFVAQKLNLLHHTVDLKGFDLLESVNETVKILGEPYFHITSIYADRILQEARKNHKVFFTGAGGDECYYGYDNLLFIMMEYYFRIARYIPTIIKKCLNYCSGSRFSSIIFSERKNFKRNYYLRNYEKVAHLFRENIVPKTSIEKIVSDMESFIIDMNDYRDISYMYGLFLENLHSLTIQSDLIGMKNSIEIRAPFLEKRVIERSFSLPFWKKVSLFRLREGKEILRKSLKDIFGYNFVYAKKIGFGTQFDFKEVFLDKYFDEIHKTVQSLYNRNLFDTGEVEKLFHDFKKNFHTIIKLYTIELTIQLYIDK